MADAKTPKGQPIVIRPVVFENVFREAPKDNQLAVLAEAALLQLRPLLALTGGTTNAIVLVWCDRPGKPGLSQQALISSDMNPERIIERLAHSLRALIGDDAFAAMMKQFNAEDGASGT